MNFKDRIMLFSFTVQCLSTEIYADVYWKVLTGAELYQKQIDMSIVRNIYNNIFQ
jgi:hypothetical protein